MCQLSPPPYPYPPKRGDRSAFHFQTISALKTMLDKPWPNRESEPEWKSSFIETINWLSFLPCLLSSFFHTSDSYSCSGIRADLTIYNIGPIPITYYLCVCANIFYMTCKVYNRGGRGARERFIKLLNWAFFTSILLLKICAISGVACEAQRYFWIFIQNAAEAYLYL